MSKNKIEVFTLPNGIDLLPSDTHYTTSLYGMSFSSLGSDVKLSLERVFNSQFTISREDMENLLRVLSPRGQKKGSSRVFSCSQNLTKEQRESVNRTIKNFPTDNWVSSDWEMFGELAPSSNDKPKKKTVKSTPTGILRLPKPTFTTLQRDYTGKGIPADFKK